MVGVGNAINGDQHAAKDTVPFAIEDIRDVAWCWKMSVMIQKQLYCLCILEKGLKSGNEGEVGKNSIGFA